jgi:hypothetical protein
MYLLNIVMMSRNQDAEISFCIDPYRSMCGNIQVVRFSLKRRVIGKWLLKSIGI